MKRLLYILLFVTSIFFVNKINAYTEYKIGDMVTYNEVDYYVIKNSSSKEDSVTMLKAEPLSVSDVNTYGGVGTANNHVNMYNCLEGDACYHAAYNKNGYGGMAYYSSVNCGYGTGSNQKDSGCTSNYADSEIKYVVDAWKNAKAPEATSASLITIDEVTSLGYEWGAVNPSNEGWLKTEDTPTWLYNSNYSYWSMTPYQDSASNVWYVSLDGSLSGSGVSNYYHVVRPVIVLSKKALGDADESDIDASDSEKVIPNSDSKKEVVTKVRVPNTYMKTSIIIIIFGFIFIASGVILFYRKANKKEGKK